MARRPYPGAKAGIAYAQCAIRKLDTDDAAVATRAADEKAEDLYELSLSSEAEVERSFFGMVWREKLDHSPKAVQLGRFKSGRSPFLADHDTCNQVGLLKLPRLEDGKLYVRVKWFGTARAQEIRQMVDEGRDTVSVGYLPKRVKLVEEDEEKGDLWLCSLWEPLEGSSVAIPADPTVGFGREQGAAGLIPVEVVEDEPAAAQKGKAMKKVRNEQGVVIEVPDDDPRPAITLDTKPPETRDYGAEQLQILALCEENKVSHLARGFCEKRMTPEAVMRELLKALKTQGGAAQPAAEHLEGLPKEEREKWSLLRCLQLSISHRDNPDKFDGLEGVMHRRLEKLLPEKQERHGGILIPLRMGDSPLVKRAMGSTVPGGGVELVFEERGDLIEYLANRTYLLRMGAQLMTGLTAPIRWPREDGEPTVYWVGENPVAGVTKTDAPFDYVLMTPKTLQGTIELPRQLLQISSIDAEANAKKRLAAGHGRAFDRAGLHGLGTEFQPLGVFNAPGVGVVAMGGAPGSTTFGKLVDITGKVADANADFGSLGFMMTPLYASKLMQTLVAAAAGSDMIWTGTYEEGRVAGYRAAATNQVSKVLGAGANEHGLLYGNWGQEIVGLFGILEIITDPYTLADKGQIKVTTFQMGDVSLLHPEAFTIGAGATIA